MALEDDTVIFCLLSAGHGPENEFALSPVDPALDLPLPEGVDLLLSERDSKAMTWAEAERRRALPEYAACRAVEAAWW